MSLKFSSFALMWFLTNAAYYHLFFVRFPREEIRIGVPALGVLCNIPITLLMMANTSWCLKKARDLGFYYTCLMFVVFMLVGLYIAARVPSRYICDDSPAFCGRHPNRETFLAFLSGLEMFLVYGGIVFLEILRSQIITCQFDAIVGKILKKTKYGPEGEALNWI